MKRISLIPFSILKLISKIPGGTVLLSLAYRRKESSLPTRLSGLCFFSPTGISVSDAGPGSTSLLESAGFGFIETETPSVKQPCSPSDGIVTATDISLDDKAGYERKMALYYDFSDMFIIDARSCAEDTEKMHDVIGRLTNVRTYQDEYKPVVLKISPEMSSDALRLLVLESFRSGIDGIMVGGKDDFRTKVAECVSSISGFTRGNMPVIAGGVADLPEAVTLIQSGASFVETGPAFLKYGPGIVRWIISDFKKSQIQA